MEEKNLDVPKINLKKTDEPQVVSLGCRLNNAESDAMKVWAEQAGLKEAIIVNTCAVTSTAERQARQTIRQLRKKNPSSYIIATGCAVQLRPKVFAAMPEVDRVIGNNAKASPESFAKDHEHKVNVGPIPLSTTQQELPLIPLKGRSKAFVQVQNGCDHFCTFCTIALARGRSRSVPVDMVIKHVDHLLQEGAKEIVLTGVDLTSYHHEGLGLGHLIEILLNKLPSLQRLRLSSLDSMEVCPVLFKVITQEKRVLPHIHLSLQAGSDEVLVAMKRRHSRSQALSLCQGLKEKRPELALGADFIAGFPGETEEMFQKTLNLVEEAGLTYLHVFPFSPRPGTPAARMPDKVAGEDIRSRSARLRQKGEQSLEQWLKGHLGQEALVLSEKQNRGHMGDFSMVHFTREVPPDLLVRVRLVDHKGAYLLGEPCS